MVDDCLIFEASRTGDRDRVMELLLAGVDATAEHVGSGITPLHDACWGGQPRYIPSCHDRLHDTYFTAYLLLT